MSTGWKNPRIIAGWVLHALVAALLLFAGAGKAFKLVPEMVEGVEKLNMNPTLIGAGALASGILLLVPRTMSIGLLLACSYWGGVICVHMFQKDSYTGPAIFLAMTWAGAFLRDPRTLGGLVTSSTRD